ncbi:YggS family pyridoxal phosphate-dependent enzyme [Legionella shakespearei]|uniref:Pyridoxal phosphate homeostasis protein n=1 Tax=Legionella shakespearei DSM 23087 TaxID=1122169 RepID=A0A0W0ZB87_9GAMM|nr:YggS family pyridoxal phosphate-dependent enzyme [Legionella shakespearei]KTD66418.1 pyridoxal-5'-phosphate dependent enzyme family transporter protein [Legionella shakespearei DSM 23087]
MTISHNIKTIKELMTQAELNAHREPGSVLLLAVSKQQNAAAITEAFRNGINHFGENYYQEARDKQEQLKDLPVSWHFIGPIQSNKTKGIAQHFDWVHSINRLKIAQLLNEYRGSDTESLQVCIQVNLIEEENKSGIPVEETWELAAAIRQLPNLELRGLMTIPPPQKNPEEQYALLCALRELKDRLNQNLNLHMDTLSMGMSDDLIPAIKAGSTIVRIGRAIFGERRGKES